MDFKTAFNTQDHCHRRFNPLTSTWILVSPHRTKRPWQGQTDHSTHDDIPTEDYKNPLSPGATRPNGKVNPEYEGTFIFSNDFPAMSETFPEPTSDGKCKDEKEEDLFKLASAPGRCDVMCFHPRANVTLPLMSVNEIVKVIQTWIDHYSKLSRAYRWIQIFENKGSMMGCSNPHPHCQIWSSKFLPNEAALKDRTQREYYERHRSPMLVDYVGLEMEKKERIVCENSHWIVLVPYWACWPYETMILPKARILRLSDLSGVQIDALADIMKRLLTRYDNLFHTSCPYSMGWHGAPTGADISGSSNYSHWQLHAIYYPPLLRSATVRKFMVGYEMLAMPQRDLTAEQAASTLSGLSDEHYKLKAQTKSE